MGKSIKEKKLELVSKWEECFDKKVSEFFNEKGIKHIWDDVTSVDEVGDMLDYAAIHLTFGKLANNLAGIIVEVVQGPTGPTKKCSNDKHADVFQVLRVNDNHLLPGKFETEEGAQEFIKEECLRTVFTLDDFKVIKVCN